jgi:hypothetical protein
MRISPDYLRIQGHPQIVQVNGKTILYNLGEVPIHNISCTISSSSVAIPSIQIHHPSSIQSLEQVPINFTISTNTTFYGLIKIAFHSADGNTIAFDMVLDIDFPVPLLVATPTSLTGNIVRGQQNIVKYQIANHGLVETGPLQIQIPQHPMLQLASPSLISTLLPQNQTSIVLLFSPPSSQPFSDFSGTIAATCAEAFVVTSFRFSIVSNDIVNFKVMVEDEFT